MKCFPRYYKTSGSILTAGSLSNTTCSSSVLPNYSFWCAWSEEVNFMKFVKILLKLSLRYYWSARSSTCQYCQKTLLKIFSAIFFSWYTWPGLSLIISVRGFINALSFRPLYFWYLSTKGYSTFFKSLPSYIWSNSSAPSICTYLLERGHRFVEFLIICKGISSLKLKSVNSSKYFSYE